MIEYIYFVKCPGCEDEAFDFFEDAKSFALSKLSNKPLIYQVEVERNDFGECTDSQDLGTVWSWEEIMSDVPMEHECHHDGECRGDKCTCHHDEVPADSQVYDKSLFTLDIDNDPEFTELDNSISDFPEDDQEEDFLLEERNAYSFRGYSIIDTGFDWMVKDPSGNICGNFESDSEAEDAVLDRISNKSINVNKLVEALEENEDQVECKWCGELFSKDECSYDDNLGYLCDQCATEIEGSLVEPVLCQWCGEAFDKSDCRYESNLGYLCDRCAAALKSRGETLTFIEGPLDEAVAAPAKQKNVYTYSNIIKYGDPAQAREDIFFQLEDAGPIALMVHGDHLEAPFVIKDWAQGQGFYDNAVGTLKNFFIKEDGTIEVVVYHHLRKKDWILPIKDAIKICIAEKTKQLLTAIVQIATSIDAGLQPTRAERAAMRSEANDQVILSMLHNEPEVAEELRSHITKVEIKVPADDYQQNLDEIDPDCDAAAKKLEKLINKFESLPFATAARKNGIVVERNIRPSDQMWQIKQRWQLEGTLYFDCEIGELSTQAQQIIEDAKVIGMVKDGQTVDLTHATFANCYRLVIALIQYFNNDVRFFDKKEAIVANPEVPQDKTALTEDNAEGKYPKSVDILIHDVEAVWQGPVKDVYWDKSDPNAFTPEWDEVELKEDAEITVSVDDLFEVLNPLPEFDQFWSEDETRLDEPAAIKYMLDNLDRLVEENEDLLREAFQDELEEEVLRQYEIELENNQLK